MSFHSSQSTQLDTTLAQLSQQQNTGELRLSSGDRNWHLYLFKGQLLYATGGRHRVRRWYRALEQHCPNVQLDAKKISASSLWEHQLLQQGVSQALLSVEQAKAVVANVLKEIVFDLSHYTHLTSRWVAYRKLPAPHVNFSWLLSPEETQQVLDKAKELYQQWQQMGLDYVSPDQAPILTEYLPLETQNSSNTFLSLKNLFNGQNTLWDIALSKKQLVTVVTRTLDYFVKQGKIEVREVPDHPSPLEQLRLVSAAINPTKFLIACIDDSPVVGHALKTILQPEGYRLITINDPMQGVATLAQHKPDLIFLDVVMPQTNGYNLCSFLRQSDLFRKTPIIILTSRDGMLDRTRAKLTGASDFLSKPPEAKKVLQMLEKYLHHDATEVFPNNATLMASS